MELSQYETRHLQVITMLTAICDKLEIKGEELEKIHKTLLNVAKEHK